MKTRPIDITSENTCSGNLPVRPVLRRDGKRNKSAFSREELSRADIARFHTKYQKTPSCWLWTASKFGHGYGQFVLERDINGYQPHVQAHRVAYVLANGDVPQGQVVMHVCDVRTCVNPAHLRVCDQATNIAYARVQGHYRNASRPSIQKITDAQVRDIRASTEKSVRLAERYGVTLPCISNIRRGRSRKAA